MDSLGSSLLSLDAEGIALVIQILGKKFSVHCAATGKQVLQHGSLTLSKYLLLTSKCNVVIIIK